MKKRATGQSSFCDLAVSGLGGPKTAALLARLDAAVPWNKLLAPILKLPEYAKYVQDPSRPGERPIDPRVMVKGLLLAKWYNLSDPQLEEQLKDRISFRRFVGLSQQDRTPDETTFVKFRRRLREADLDQVIFDTILKHVERQGLLLKEGTWLWSPEDPFLYELECQRAAPAIQSISAPTTSAAVWGVPGFFRQLCLEGTRTEASDTVPRLTRGTMPAAAPPRPPTVHALRGPADARRDPMLFAFVRSSSFCR